MNGQKMGFDSAKRAKALIHWASQNAIGASAGKELTVLMNDKDEITGDWKLRRVHQADRTVADAGHGSDENVQQGIARANDEAGCVASATRDVRSHTETPGLLPTKSLCRSSAKWASGEPTPSRACAQHGGIAAAPKSSTTRPSRSISPVEAPTPTAQGQAIARLGMKVSGRHPQRHGLVRSAARHGARRPASAGDDDHDEESCRPGENVKYPDEAEHHDHPDEGRGHQVTAAGRLRSFAWMNPTMFPPQFLGVGLVEIHHVAALVVLDRDIFPQAVGNAQVVDAVERAIDRHREVAPAADRKGRGGVSCFSSPVRDAARRSPTSPSNSLKLQFTPPRMR